MLYLLQKVFFWGHLIRIAVRLTSVLPYWDAHPPARCIVGGEEPVLKGESFSLLCHLSLRQNGSEIRCLQVNACSSLGKEDHHTQTTPEQAAGRKGTRNRC